MVFKISSQNASGSGSQGGSMGFPCPLFTPYRTRIKSNFFTVLNRLFSNNTRFNSTFPSGWTPSPMEPGFPVSPGGNGGLFGLEITGIDHHGIPGNPGSLLVLTGHPEPCNVFK
jgi:hypothetical protein